MITLFTGTPGSGKSFHAAKLIYNKLLRKCGIICNFPVNKDAVNIRWLFRMKLSKRKKSRVKADFVYKKNDDLTPRFLVDYAKKNHKFGKESQTLVIIDEAQLMFNSRSWARSDRKDWIAFFSQHRKYGFDIILITQDDRMLDRQIRALIEVETRHRKVQNAGFLFWWIYVFTLGSPLFIALSDWYGGSGIRIDTEWIKYKPHISEIYNSYIEFGDAKDDSMENMMMIAGATGTGAGYSGGDPLGGGPGIPATGSVVAATVPVIDAIKIFQQSRMTGTANAIPEEVLEEEVQNYGRF